jgi:hypothetical protein
MEVSSISGPDAVPRDFSIQQPRQAEPERNEAPPVNRSAPPAENNKGTTIDTYA